MPLKRYPPDDPREWLNRSASSLSKAKCNVDSEDIYPEDVCFDAQQCIEKALKGILLHRTGGFPKTHSIEYLAGLIAESGIVLPDEVKDASALTQYAQNLRYPGWSEEATANDAETAIAVATAVLKWAKSQIASKKKSIKGKRVRR